jgi:hypothetical protein
MRWLLESAIDLMGETLSLFREDIMRVHVAAELDKLRAEIGSLRAEVTLLRRWRK